MAKLNQRLVILVSASDKRLIKRTAAERGKGVGEFIREAVLTKCVVNEIVNDLAKGK